MAYCKEEGKDRIVFDVEGESKSTIKFPKPDKSEDENWTKGFVLDDGKLNWECSCRGSMVASRCGVESREFFTCAYENKDSEEQVPECMEAFDRLRDCMNRNSVYYTLSKSEDDDELNDDVQDNSADKATKSEKVTFTNTNSESEDATKSSATDSR